MSISHGNSQLRTKITTDFIKYHRKRVIAFCHQLTVSNYRALDSSSHRESGASRSTPSATMRSIMVARSMAGKFKRYQTNVTSNNFTIQSIFRLSYHFLKRSKNVLFSLSIQTFPLNSSSSFNNSFLRLNHFSLNPTNYFIQLINNKQICTSKQ